MNSRSNSDSSQRAATSFNSHDFDFGLGFSRSSSGSGSLNAQKQQNAAQNTYAGVGSGSGWASGGGGGASWAQKPASSSISSSSSSSASAWSWQSSSGSSALHAPPRSMVGDITGKSWGAMDNTSKGSNVKSGLVSGLSRGASPNLFGDLLGASTALASSLSGKSQQQASQGYKSPPLSNLEAMAASLPKGVPMKEVKAAKGYQAEEMGDFVSAGTKTNASSQDAGWAAFEAISSKPKSSFTDQAKMPQKSSQHSSNEDPYGDFQGVPSTKATTPVATNVNVDPFAASSHMSTNFSGNASKQSGSSSSDFFNFTSNAAASARAQTSKKADTPAFSNSIDLDPFAFLNSNKTAAATHPINTQSDGSVDPFESVFGKVSSVSTRSKLEDPVMETLWGSAKPEPGFSTQSASNSWGIETDFGGGDNAEATTELDGLPPPPPGVSASLSKDKGLEYYKQGQFADAIKWLSWAEVLLHQSGESSQIIEVLTCRSSCLKEAGEYKKAVADCSQVFELDNGNTGILLQRALLYESMEKYKLGIADLKEVLKREPQNRVANNTLARLKKMGD
eukprot:c19115_g1_i1 orf=167-1858(-)